MLDIEGTKSVRVLVVVPCGRSKIWRKKPQAGPTLAKDAYQGSPFKVNRRFAECFGDHWMILSAKYGFIQPDFLIPGPYEVTFKRKASNPVSKELLQRQVQELRLGQFTIAIGLGGKEYRQVLADAFQGSGTRLQFPFAGLPVGRSMQAANIATKARKFSCANCW